MASTLFLDDNEERISRFKHLNSMIEIDIARTAQEAIDFLSKALSNNTPYEFVSLDHDLNGVVYQKEIDRNCGMEVVRWICKNKPVIKTVVVHSWNYKAATAMRNDLSRAGYFVFYCPFYI